MSSHDVVVVGAGHNALVAACYLARAGLDVAVVERDTVLGGAVSTVERFPGYRMDRGSSAHVMVRMTGIVEDLQLEQFGLTYVDMDPWAFAPPRDADEPPITFHTDLDATVASVEAACGSRDADAYRRFVQLWGARNRVVMEAFSQRATPSALGRSLWRTGTGTGVEGMETARQMLVSGDALLDETFTCERLKTALSWLGAQSGPPTHEGATADLVGWNTLMHDQAPGHPVGGSGMLCEALAGRLRHDGGAVLLGDAVTEITTSHRRVTGVRTQSGRHLQAPVVVAGCHVLTTLALVGEKALPTGLARRAARTIRTGNGIGMVLRVASTGLPTYPGRHPGAHDGMQLLARSRSQLRTAHAAFLDGRTPDDPPLLLMTPSVSDPTLAPPGHHTTTVWAQWYPYRLSGARTWDDLREAETDKLLDGVERWAPGFRDSVLHVHTQTPLDLERELGLIDGQVMHVDMSLDQMFAFRPLPELADLTVDALAGLYLTGASMHPGGGVHGASGRTAARTVLRDLDRASRQRRRWRRGDPLTIRLPARPDRGAGAP